MEKNFSLEELNNVSEIDIVYKRKSKCKVSVRPKITTSRDCYEVFVHYWNEDKIELLEEFKVLLLNRANRVLQILPLSHGGMTGTVALSSGEFVGLVADNPDEKIKLKMFHAQIINDADKLNAEVRKYKDIPVVSNVTQQQVLDNYYQVKMEVKRLIGEEVGRLKAVLT
jgi:hypothetical protein